jgi:signal recognition particle subunit SRP72
VNVASASSTAIPAKPIEKKVRLSRVPKGVVPGVTPPPDPERWIKKSERTNIGHTAGKRRKAAGGGATQGSLAETVSGHATKSSGAKHRKKK